MAIEHPATSTRRALLGAGLGALAATAATALVRPQPVNAGIDGDVLLGGPNASIGVTAISNSTADGTAFAGYATGTGSGIYGQNDTGPGVFGNSGSGDGVYGLGGKGVHGFGIPGVGVFGESTLSVGVRGESGATDQPAMLGVSKLGNTGLHGHSGSLASVRASPTKTGVYGYAIQDGSARGVAGESTSGRGVNGVATSGVGVYGHATSGEGVHGSSGGSNGVAGSSASSTASGVYGENTAGGAGTYGRSNSAAGNGAYGESTSGTGVTGSTDSGVGVQASAGSAGTAFVAQGRVVFSTAGLTSLEKGVKSKTITPGVDLALTSLILCTLESNQSGLSIQRLIKNATLNTFTVYLSAGTASAKSAKVAWFVIG